MKNAPLSSVRCDALLRLYRVLDRAERRGDARAAEIAEHALTLVLSEERDAADAARLYRNAWRDARRVVDDRRKRLRVSHVHTESAPTESDSEAFDLPLVEPGATLGGPPSEPSFSSDNMDAFPSPRRVDDELEGDELLARLDVAVHSIPSGRIVLRGLLLGESISESATTLGVRHVRYLRQLVREQAEIVWARAS